MADNIPQGSDAVGRIGKDPLKLKLAMMLANGARLDKDMSQIAEEVGAARSTCYRWMDDDTFKAAVFYLASEALKAEVPNAYAEIGRLVKNKDPKVRLRALELLLKLTGSLIERSETTVHTDAKELLKGYDDNIQDVVSELRAVG